WALVGACGRLGRLPVALQRDPLLPVVRTGGSEGPGARGQPDRVAGRRPAPVGHVRRRDPRPDLDRGSPLLRRNALRKVPGDEPVRVVQGAEVVQVLEAKDGVGTALLMVLILPAMSRDTIIEFGLSSVRRGSRD